MLVPFKCNLDKWTPMGRSYQYWTATAIAFWMPRVRSVQESNTNGWLLVAYESISCSPIFVSDASVTGAVLAAPEGTTSSQVGKSAVNDISEHIKQLAGAKNFADSVKGENGKFHESYALYRKVFDEALGTDVKQLEWLRANGSPSGKVYGAVLLYESSKLGLEDAFKPLLGDH